MNTKDLSMYISENKEIPLILEKLGMTNINDKHPKYITCGMPDGDNPNSTLIYKDEFLTVVAYTRNIKGKEDRKPNLYNLIMHINKCEFESAKSWCCSILGLSNEGSKKVKNNDHTSFFRNIKRRRNNRNANQVYYDLDILDSFLNIPHIDLIKKDGIISQKILDKYMVRYDSRSNRIIFPHLKHDDKTKIAGIVGRTTIKAWEELKIPKYMSMLNTEYEKRNNLYALSLNIDEIKKVGRVIIFEAEKSVMKADMFGYGYGVAVGCHEISDIQRKMLISLDVEIIIAFDKDVELEHIKSLCKQMNSYRKVSYIYDNYNLLNEKDSPVDKGYRKWSYLFNHRIVYKEEECVCQQESN